MNRNYAINMSPAIWIAPLFAPIGGIVFLLNMPNGRVDLWPFYIAATVVISYLFTALLAVPVLGLTRRWVHWSAFKVIALSFGLPCLFYGILLVNSVLDGQYPALAEGRYLAVLRNEFSSLAGFIGASLSVSVAYIALHRKIRQ